MTNKPMKLYLFSVVSCSGISHFQFLFLFVIKRSIYHNVFDPCFDVDAASTFQNFPLVLYLLLEF